MSRATTTAGVGGRFVAETHAGVNKDISVLEPKWSASLPRLLSKTRGDDAVGCESGRTQSFIHHSEAFRVSSGCDDSMGPTLTEHEWGSGERVRKDAGEGLYQVWGLQV